MCEEFISQREMALKGLFEMDKESQSKRWDFSHRFRKQTITALCGGGTGRD